MSTQTDSPDLLSIVERDEESFLLYPDDWTRDIGIAIARETIQEKSKEHWQIIQYIRDELELTQKVPEARSVLKHMRLIWGENKATRRYLYTLFPRGYGQ